MNLPSLNDIVRLNRSLIQNTKGFYIEPDNLLNRGSLEWVLDSMKHEIFGVNVYPSVAEKAAILAWTIIKKHVFWDGNKRTGMAALEILIELNGFELSATDDEIEEAALKIASQSSDGEYRFGCFVEWVRQRIKPQKLDVLGQPLLHMAFHTG